MDAVFDPKTAARKAVNPSRTPVICLACAGLRQKRGLAAGTDAKMCLPTVGIGRESRKSHTHHLRCLWLFWGPHLRFDFMKTSRLIVWPAILVVAGLLCWLGIQRPPASRIRVHVENDNDTPAQTSAAHPISSYDYYFIAQNRSPEVVVTLKLEPAAKLALGSRLKRPPE